MSSSTLRFEADTFSHLILSYIRPTLCNGCALLSVSNVTFVIEAKLLLGLFSAGSFHSRSHAMQIARSNLEKFTNKAASGTELERAEAEIGVEVYTAMVKALE